MADWFKDWFSSDYYLSVYSHRDDDDADRFLNNILKYIPLQSGLKALDAACGSGRHAIQLALKNFDVTAFDLSVPLLNIAIADTLAQNLDIKYFNGDLRFVRLKEKFNIILNLFTSFGYFENDEENFAFIKSSYAMLEDNGFFVFDYFNAEYLRKNLVCKSEKTINGLKIKEKRRIRDERIVKNITIENEGVINEFEESVRLYNSDEIIERITGFGYKVVKIFGNYNCEEFSPDNSERLIIIFQK